MDGTWKQQNRESSFELLRLLCIFGIVTMHTFGSFYASATGINLVYGVLLNSIFNMGVSLFMLISGYFGIRTSAKKIVHLELAAIFYSMLHLLYVSYLQGALSKKALIRACFPVSDGTYWYITCYMILLLFAPFINQIPEKLKKKDFEKLLVLMLLVFCVLPSVIQLHVMGDNGKGVVNMLLMYLIGRYLKLYGKENYGKAKMLLYGGVCVLAGFVLNYGLSLLINKGQGIYAPFARDCSVTIVFGSIFFFLLFREIKLQSKVINFLAKYVIGIYMFEGTFRGILRELIDITVYGDKWYLFVVITIYVLVTMVACIIVDILREQTIGRLDKPIAGVLDKLFQKMTGCS